MSDITKKYVDYAGLQEYDSQIKGVISTDFVGATSSADGAAGRVPAPESGDENKFLRGDGTWAAPAAGSVTGVKGNAESTYRDGDVNITPANIGLGNVGNYKSVSTVADQGLTTTEQENARTNIGALDDSIFSNCDSWSPKTWNGLTNFYGREIWTDGDNIYYSFVLLSDGTSQQYVLNVATSTWSPKTWNGLTAFYGQDIWTDGDDIYYSTGNTQYVLDVATSTWSPKTWNGLTTFEGRYVWTDGSNIYYSYISFSDGTNYQYVLDVATSTWSPKAWNGRAIIYGNQIWTDGDNIYWSSYNHQYVLDIATSTWSPKTWNGFSDISGDGVWTDGDDIYYSRNGDTYILDKSTSTWSPKTWDDALEIESGEYIWNDGTSTYYSRYYSDNSDQYVLNKSKVLGTAAIKDVAISGDASATQVVMGNDSRLTDARNAADVPAWAKASTKPTYTTSEVGIFIGTSSEWDQLTSTQKAAYTVVILTDD